jgi:adenosine kinase
MNIIVSGSLAYDRIMNFPGDFSDHILPEKIHNLNISFPLETYTENFGGTAGNIAYTLALLGEKPAVIANAGNDFEPYRAWMAKHNIDTAGISVMSGEKTSFCYIMTDRSDNQITAFYPGAMKLPEKMAGQSSMVNAIAIVAPGYPENMRQHVENYKKNKIDYIYDPGQQITVLDAQDIVRGIEGSKAMICNDYELNMIIAKTAMEESEILAKTEILVTTLGNKGCTIKTKDLKYDIPAAKPENTSDPTGAGDAFRAGLLKGIVSGLPLEIAGRLGSTVAVYTVEKYGTQTHSFTLDELKARYKQNYHQELPL